LFQTETRAQKETNEKKLVIHNLKKIFSKNIG